MMSFHGFIASITYMSTVISTVLSILNLAFAQNWHLSCLKDASTQGLIGMSETVFLTSCNLMDMVQFDHCALSWVVHIYEIVL